MDQLAVVSYSMFAYDKFVGILKEIGEKITPDARGREIFAIDPTVSSCTLFHSGAECGVAVVYLNWVRLLDVQVPSLDEGLIDEVFKI